jgi:hypothetical protein
VKHLTIRKEEWLRGVRSMYSTDGAGRGCAGSHYIAAFGNFSDDEYLSAAIAVVFVGINDNPATSDEDKIRDLRTLFEQRLDTRVEFV